MKIWKDLVWPFLSKILKYMLSLFERTASEIAKKIPVDIIEPIKSMIVEVALRTDITGSEKMKIVKAYALSLLGDKFSVIGDSALDTFLQVLYQDLKNKGLA